MGITGHFISQVSYSRLGVWQGFNKRLGTEEPESEEPFNKCGRFGRIPRIIVVILAVIRLFYLNF